MSIVTDGPRSEKWRAFAKQKLQMLKDAGLESKIYIINGYRIMLSTSDGFDKALITAPPYTSLGGGYNHFLMVDPRGDLWAWGVNFSGQLGLGDLAPRTLPERVLGGVPWAMVARGRGAMSAGIRKDGTLWVWGRNNSDTGVFRPEYRGILGLGLGHSDAVVNPAQIGTEHTWAYITTGLYVMYAIKTDGTLWVWGRDYGVLGLGNITDPDGRIVSEPTQVGTANNWRTASAEHGHAMALQSDGTLWGVGANFSGALGLGDTNNRYAFTQVGADVWRVILACREATVGIKHDGTLWATGGGTGSNFRIMFKAPGLSFEQIGGDSDWVDVAGNEDVLIAVKADGSVWTAGFPCDSKLGPGSLSYTSCPTGFEPGLPLTNIGRYASRGGIFATQFTVMSVDTSGAQWWWGLRPQDTDDSGANRTPVPITDIPMPDTRLMLPATEPLVPPWW